MLSVCVKANDQRQ